MHLRVANRDILKEITEASLTLIPMVSDGRYLQKMRVGTQGWVLALENEWEVADECRNE